MKSLICFLFLLPTLVFGEVKVGVDLLLEDHLALLAGKRIGLISNQTAVSRTLETTFERLRKGAGKYHLKCLFAPEHGFYGNTYAYESVSDEKLEGIPLYGLFGARRRPTPEMLEDLDVLIYDIQDIGSRSYTFISTLFYCMEEAAKHKIPFLVLDRPNPMGGEVVDGPLVEDK